MSDIHEIQRGVEEAVAQNNAAIAAKTATAYQIDRIGEGVAVLAQRLAEDLSSLEGLGFAVGRAGAHMADVSERRAGVETTFAASMNGARPDAVQAVQGGLQETQTHEVNAAEAVGQMDAHLAYAYQCLRAAVRVLTPDDPEGGQFALWHRAAASELQASVRARDAVNMAAAEYLVSISADGGESIY